MDLSVPSKLFHYTSIGSLALILKNRSIRLSRLDTVDDVSEALSKDAVQYAKYLFVTCWTDKEEVSIPFWHMYTPNMAGVRLGLSTPIFQTYSIKSDSNKALVANDFEGKSILPLERLHGTNYIVMPENPFKFYKMEYTDDEDLLHPQVYSLKEDGARSLALGNLGKYKKTEWSFQDEWRYRLLIFPSAPPPSTSYADLRYMDEFLSHIGQTIFGKEPPFEFFFHNYSAKNISKIS